MADSLEKFGYQQQLKRSLSFWDLLIYGMLFMVPAAPMGVYGFVLVQSEGMVPLVYVVGAVAMLFTAISYAKLSREFPIAGSVYAYVQRGINPHVGFVGGWTILLDYIMIPALLYAFVGVWLNSLFPVIPVWGFVLILLGINTIINVLGIEMTARANWALLIFQVAILAVFLVIGVMYIFSPSGPGLSIAPFYQPGKLNLGFIATATSIAVLSFLGFDGIATLAEEVPNPERQLGRAMIASLLIIGSIFVLETYIAQLAHPSTEGLPAETAFFEVAGSIGGEWLKQATLWCQIIGAGLANSLVAQASISRILFSMSRDKMLPGFFAVVHDRFKTPYLSTLFVAGFTLVMALALSLELLIKLVNFGALTSFLFLNFTVFWFFFIRKGSRGPRGIFDYLIMPFIGMAIIAYVWWGFDEVTKIVGICWLILGVIYGAVKSKFYKEVPEAFRNVQI